MDLQQKLINEYQKTQEIKKQILDLQKEYKLNLDYKKDIDNEIIYKKQEIKKQTYQKFKEYQLRMEHKEGITIKYEDVPQKKLIDKGLLEDLDNLNKKLEKVSYEAESSFKEWNYLKKAMDTPSMEEIYAKDTQEDKPSTLQQV